FLSNCVSDSPTPLGPRANESLGMRVKEQDALRIGQHADALADLRVLIFADAGPQAWTIWAAVHRTIDVGVGAYRFHQFDVHGDLIRVTLRIQDGLFGYEEIFWSDTNDDVVVSKFQIRWDRHDVASDAHVTARAIGFHGPGHQVHGR